MGLPPPKERRGTELRGMRAARVRERALRAWRNGVLMLDVVRASRIKILSPRILNPKISNPEIQNPRILNPKFLNPAGRPRGSGGRLAPGGLALGRGQMGSALMGSLQLFFNVFRQRTFLGVNLSRSDNFVYVLLKQYIKVHYFCSGPISVDPFVRNQGACCSAARWSRWSRTSAVLRGFPSGIIRNILRGTENISMAPAQG